MPRVSSSTKIFSRKLRREMTDAEMHLWQQLRMQQMQGLKFRRQHPFGKYILDFACIDAKLAIEVDGSQHSELQEHDSVRTAWLTAQGWKVLRFWNNEVLQNMKGVVETIYSAVREQPPS